MSTKNLVGASEEVVNERDSLWFHPWFRRFNIWLGNFGILGVKIGEGIFGFRPQPNQFFRFRPKVLTKFREDRLKNATVIVPTDTVRRA